MTLKNYYDVDVFRSPFQIALYDSQFAYHERKSSVNVVTGNAYVYLAFNNIFALLLLRMLCGRTFEKICKCLYRVDSLEFGRRLK